MKGLANGFERGESNGAGATGFEYRQILRRDADRVGEIIGSHFSFRKHDVKIDGEGHRQFLLDRLCEFFVHPCCFVHDGSDHENEQSHEKLAFRADIERRCRAPKRFRELIHEHHWISAD